MKELKPQVKSALFWLGGLILAGALFGSGYKLAEKNFSSKLIEGPTPTPVSTLMPTPTEGIKEEPKPIIFSQVPKDRLVMKMASDTTEVRDQRNRHAWIAQYWVVQYLQASTTAKYL